MRLNSLSFVAFLGAVATACSAPPNEGIEVDSSEADITAAGIGVACSPPLRSSDGAYALVDLCASDIAEGRVARIDLATNALTVVATYSLNDRVENLSERGSAFVFDVLRDVDAQGNAGRGIDVHVHDWSLATGRAISATDLPHLAALDVTDDGKHVFYAADRHLKVATVATEDAPVDVDLGEDADPSTMRFSTKGDKIVGHAESLDAANPGEIVYLVDTDAAPGPRLTGKPRAKLTSPSKAAGSGKRVTPFDGSRVWGVRAGTTQNELVAFDPRSGNETVLDSGLGLRVITGVGDDVLYTTQLETASGIDVTLKRIPAAGGTATVLATATMPTRAHADVAFDLVTIGSSGTYGVFRSVPASAQPTSAYQFERWLVKLDGTASGTKLGGTGLSYMNDSFAGDHFMYTDRHANGTYGRLMVDLTTATVTSAGVNTSYDDAIVVGDGSFIELLTCTGPTFGDTWRELRHVTPTGSTISPCGRTNWTDTALTIAESPVVVFYSESGTGAARRYPIAIVKP